MKCVYLEITKTFEHFPDQSGDFRDRHYTIKILGTNPIHITSGKRHCRSTVMRMSKNANEINVLPVNF